MKVLSFTNFNIGFAATLPERSLFKGLHDRGVDLTVVLPDPNNESAELEDYGIKVIFLPVRKKFDFKAIRLIRELVKRNNFDIIHLTFSKAITNVLIATFGLRVKLVAYIGSTSVHWHDPMAYLSFLNPRLDRLICLSNGVEEHMLKQAPRRLKGKTVRIYKGYETAWFDHIKPAGKIELNIPENGIIICSVANVRRIKGIKYLIRSAGFLPDNLPVYFLLIGKGMDSSPISRLVKNSKYSDNFRIMGFSSDVLSFTAACDIYVQPSITEGLGRSVIEAMCLGKPIITSGTGGVAELVDEGVNGFHIPSRSPSAIAGKILLCHNAVNDLKKMGEKSRERIKSQFSSAKMIEETFHLFSSIVSLQ
jgi:glycosyltransferase involved in cell wall biosynthesis